MDEMQTQRVKTVVHKTVVLMIAIATSIFYIQFVIFP